MPFPFRVEKTVDGRKIMSVANALHAKLKELDGKLEELDTSLSELITLIQKRKSSEFFSEYFDIREGRSPIVLIIKQELGAKLKEYLINLQKKYDFTLVIERNRNKEISRLPFLLDYIYERHNRKSFWIAILKRLDVDIFVSNEPRIVFSYPYPTKNAKYQEASILNLINRLKQKVYVAESDLVGFDNLFYYTVKYFNKKNLSNVIPLVIGVAEKISIEKLETVIKYMSDWGQNDVRGE